MSVSDATNALRACIVQDLRCAAAERVRALENAFAKLRGAVPDELRGALSDCEAAAAELMHVLTILEAEEDR